MSCPDKQKKVGVFNMSASPLMVKLIDKAKEAFLMAIEVYNKPSIRYRVEGFSFFICNAWELMLKARIIQTSGESAIYYKDNPNRTITLENCIRLVFTNEHAPIRKNLEKIVELRNTSTHFIMEEYEMVYIPLFQACVFNFNEKMMEFHSVDMTSIVPENFLTLTASIRALTATEIRAKYPKEIAERLLTVTENINTEIAQNNSDFAIRIDHRHFITKNKSEATEILAVSKDADSKVQIIKELKDPNDSFKYTAKKCIKEINSRLSRAGIQLIYQGNPISFNSYHFDLFNKYYDIKSNAKLCFVFRGRNKKRPQKHHSESQRSVKEKKKLTPGAWDSWCNHLLPFGNPAFILHELASLVYSIGSFLSMEILGKRWAEGCQINPYILFICAESEKLLISVQLQKNHP